MLTLFHLQFWFHCMLTAYITQAKSFVVISPFNERADWELFLFTSQLPCSRNMWRGTQLVFGHRHDSLVAATGSKLGTGWWRFNRAVRIKLIQKFRWRPSKRSHFIKRINFKPSAFKTSWETFREHLMYVRVALIFLFLVREISAVNFNIWVEIHDLEAQTEGSGDYGR